MFESFKEMMIQYLKAPGHVIGTKAIIPEDIIERDRDKTIRPRMLIQTLTGSPSLALTQTDYEYFVVSVMFTTEQIDLLISTFHQLRCSVEEDLSLKGKGKAHTGLPPPIWFRTCFFLGNVNLNQDLVDTILTSLDEEDDPFRTEGSTFERWVHEQLWDPDFNRG